METLCNSINSSIATHNPLSQLLVLQVLNVLKKDTSIQNNLGKHCMELYNIVNDETLAINEQKMENIKIQTELASSNAEVEELTAAFKVYNAIENVLNEKVLRMKNESVQLQNNWRHEYYEDRKVTFDSRMDINNGRLSKFEDKMLHLIHNISSIVQESESPSISKLESSLKESENYIKELKLIKNEYESIYSALFSEIKDVYKVSKAFKNDYDVLNIKAASIEQKHPKEGVINGLESKLNEAEVNLKKCKREVDVLKLVKSQKALNELLYLYYKYDNKLTGLHRAFLKCDMNQVKLLLEHGFSDSKIYNSESGNTPLHNAAMYGCSDIVLWIVSKNGSLVNKKNKQGQTPLHLSAQYKHLDATVKLIASGANVNALSNYQGMPLHIAAQNGDEQLAKVLLNKKATVDATTKDLYTPLHVAAENHQLEVARLLVENKANVNAPTKQKFTPLHISARNGNLEMSTLLFQHGASLTIMSTGNCTPLHEALNYGKMEVAKFFINITAEKMKLVFLFENLLTDSCRDVEDKELFQSRVKSLLENYIPNREEKLFKAVKDNNISLTRALLTIGTIPSPRDAEWYQGTPLLWAASQGFLEVVNLLLQAGAKLSEADVDGSTALHWAADTGHSEVIELLLKYHAQTEAYDNVRKTPLHIAVSAGNQKIVQLLTDANADLSAYDDGGNTALHYAANLGYYEICLILVNKGAPLETKDNFGRTPLHHAAKQGHLVIVKLFVAHGADIYARDLALITPSQLAFLNNKLETAELLQSLEFQK